MRLYRPSEDNWGIEIRDSGIGIPPEAKERIFQPFYQVEGGPGHRQGGAGLGLAIVRHLVTMMGGHIEVESQLGIGSTFRITLPIQGHLDTAAPGLLADEILDQQPQNLEGK